MTDLSKRQANDLAERRGSALSRMRSQLRLGRTSMIQSGAGFGLAFVGGALVEGRNIGPAPLSMLIGIGGAVGRAATVGRGGALPVLAYGAEAIGHGWAYKKGEEIGDLASLFGNIFNGNGNGNGNGDGG